MAARASSADLVPEHSDFWYRKFVVYLRGYFRKNFHAVRTSRAGLPSRSSEGGRLDIGSGPLIVYSNHPSWWDPIHFSLLASVVLPERRLYGPMDAEALEKYSFFKKLGVFGIDRSSRGVAESRQRRASVRFLRTSLAILEQERASLWLTAEGQFTDPRGRPVQILPGVAHLARRLDGGWVVPLALEYPFWNERDPEALSRFGKPIDLSTEPDRSVQEWTLILEQGLEDTMNALAKEARSRDPRHFKTVLAGRAGVGGIYDQWRRLKARLAGRKFSAAHGDGPEAGSRGVVGERRS